MIQVKPNQPFSEYFRSPGLSSSQGKMLAPGKAPIKFVHGLFNPRPDTAAFLLGRAVHCLTLTPNLFGRDLLISVANTRNAKAYKMLREERPDKDIILEHEYHLAADMANAITRTERVADILEDAHCEQSHYCRVMDLELKARPDIYTYKSDYILADIKTTACAAEHVFNREIFKFGYDFSLAWYSLVMQQTIGAAPDRWLWIAVEKDPPYVVEIYEASRETRELAKQKVWSALECFQQCFDADKWPGYSTTGITEINPPKWAY